MPAKFRHFKTYVAGVRHPNADGTSRQKIIATLEPLERMTFIRDENNQFDENAVEVRRLSGSQIGFLPRDVAATISSRMKKDWRYTSFVIGLPTDFDDGDEDDDEGTEVTFVDLMVLEGRPGVSDEEAQRYVNQKMRPEILAMATVGTEPVARGKSSVSLAGVIIMLGIVAIILAIRQLWPS